MMVKLWSINKWLRYTGFRLVVEVEKDTDLPISIGVKFYGWSEWDWF